MSLYLYDNDGSCRGQVMTHTDHVAAMAKAGPTLKRFLESGVCPPEDVEEAALEALSIGLRALASKLLPDAAPYRLSDGLTQGKHADEVDPDFDEMFPEGDTEPTEEERAQYRKFLEDEFNGGFQ